MVITILDLSVRIKEEFHYHGTLELLYFILIWFDLSFYFILFYFLDSEEACNYGHIVISSFSCTTILYGSIYKRPRE